jgi:hypothetical protein
MWDLNDVAPSSFNLVEAVGISDEGIIAGTASVSPNSSGPGATAFVAVRKN